MRRCVIPTSGSRSAAAYTSSKLRNGSPIPMKTRWFDRLEPPEVQHLVEDLGRLQVAAELHRARGAERAGERAARLRRDADRAAAVAVAHQHRLDRMPVGGAEERLHGAVRGLAPRPRPRGSRRERRPRARRAARAAGSSSRRSRRRRAQPTPTPGGRGRRARRGRRASRSSRSRSTCARVASRCVLLRLRRRSSRQSHRAAREEGGRHEAHLVLHRTGGGFCGAGRLGRRSGCLDRCGGYRPGEVEIDARGYRPGAVDTGLTVQMPRVPLLADLAIF